MSTTPSSALPLTSARAMGERALVLGGGGGAGNAWEIGVIAGLCDAGLDVTEADLIIGTSAGSTVAAQITSASRPAELLAGILAAAPPPRNDPAGAGRGRIPDRPATDHLEKTGEIIGAAENAADMRRRMGAAALEMDPAPGSSAQTQRRATVAAQLPSQHWPQRPVLIVAVDAHTGEPVMPPEWGTHLAAQAGELRAHGSKVETIFPDSNFRSAFGANMMDPSTRPPAARAGYDQGRALAGQLTEFWR